jgi:hypothetical protein
MTHVTSFTLTLSNLVHPSAEKTKFCTRTNEYNETLVLCVSILIYLCRKQEANSLLAKCHQIFTQLICSWIQF